MNHDWTSTPRPPAPIRETLCLDCGEATPDGRWRCSACLIAAWAACAEARGRTVTFEVIARERERG